MTSPSQKEEAAKDILMDALAAVLKVTGNDRASQIIFAFTTGLEIGASDPELARALQGGLFRQQNTDAVALRQHHLDQGLAGYRERMGLTR